MQSNFAASCLCLLACPWAWTAPAYSNEENRQQSEQQEAYIESAPSPSQLDMQDATSAEKIHEPGEAEIEAGNVAEFDSTIEVVTSATADDKVEIPDESETGIEEYSVEESDTAIATDDDASDINGEVSNIEITDNNDSSEINEKAAEFLIDSESKMEQKIDAVDNDNMADDRGLATQARANTIQPLLILGKIVNPGKMKRLRWVASETLYGSKLESPVYVLRGEKAGLTLCLTAAIHGDELNGVEIVRQLVNEISPAELSGTLIGVPIVNLLGFTRGTRYLPDRRDLNRYFPGNPNGSSASRIAYSFFEEIIRHCDALVDMHTGSLNRTNMPQLRANLKNPVVLEFTQKFGSTAVLHSGKIRGNLRSAATSAGVPAVALELGEPGSLQKKQIKEGVKIIETLLTKLNMIKRHRGRAEPQPVYYSSRWVRVDNGGLLTTRVKVGARIKKGTILGRIVNPLSNESYEVTSPYNGRLLGMALNQFMLPGYAAFNIGLVAEETAVILDAQTFECTGTGMDPEQVNEEFGCSSEEGEEIEDADSLSGNLTGIEESELH